MNILGLADYDSESEHSEGQATTEIENIENAVENHSQENQAGFSSSSCVETETKVELGPSSKLCGEDDESRFPYLSKMPKIDPALQPDPNTTDSVKYYLEAMKLHNFNLTEVIAPNISSSMK